VHRERI